MAGPSALERVGERLLRSLVSLGLTPSSWPASACGTVILEVKGRRSGRPRSVLVTWVAHESDRFLVSMTGSEPDWVKNARAAGGTVVLRCGRRRDEVRLEELAVDRRAPVLRAWYGFTARSPVPRRHFQLGRTAAIQEFERIAGDHRVFRVVPAPREAEASAARHVTRDVEPWAVRDLMDDPPRATVAFVERDAVDALPVRARFAGGRHLFGVVAERAPDLGGREVLLVRDGGAYWFELRGISVRGLAERVDPPGAGAPERLAWYAVAPRRVLAWDYGAIREE